MDWFGKVAEKIDHERTGAPVAPFVVPVSGNVWAVATNRSVLVAAPAKECALPTGTGYIAGAVIKMITSPPKEGGDQVDLAAFREFVGHDGSRMPCAKCESSLFQTCETCGGTQEAECACRECNDRHTRECPDCENGKTECEGCDGTGLSRRYPRPARLGDVTVDLNLLATFAHDVPGETARMFIANAESPVWFEGDGWVAVVMPYRHDGPTDKVWPIQAKQTV